MKLTLFLTLVSISFVCGGGAWKENTEYKYKLVSKVFISVPETNENGAISVAHVTIRPLNEHLLIGEITQVGFTRIDEHGERISNMAEESEELKEAPLNKEFMIHLRNGAVSSLSVDSAMTTKQIVQFQVIASQFQIDLKAQNVVESGSNHLPDANNTASYKTMEPYHSGECETTYHISRLPSEYLENASRDSIPLPELADKGEVIEILKTRNYIDCNERAQFILDLAKENSNLTGNDNSLNARILVTGSLDDYTIQSSVTTNKVFGLKETTYVTLESVGKIDVNSNYSYDPENLQNIRSLVISTNSPKNEGQMDDTENSTSTVLQHSGSDIPERWSGCWTDFPSGENICKNSFSTEWVVVDTKRCGWKDLGKMALCRHIYKGCEATSCFSHVFYSISTLCHKQFGNRLPITKGTLDDCFLGFVRARCCPNNERKPLLFQCSCVFGH